MLITEMPSGMKSYPPNTKFELRKYTLGELKRAAGGFDSLRERYEFILDGLSTNMDKMKLSLYDANFIGIQRKIITFNQRTFRFISWCNKCNKEVIDTVQSHQIAFYDLKAPELPINIELNDGTKMSFSIMELGKFLELMETEENPNWDQLMAVQCCSHPYPEALKIITQNTSLIDEPILDQVDQLLYHGVMPIEIECQEITYKEKENALISISELRKKSYEELKQFAMDSGVGYDEKMTNPTAIVNQLVFALDLGEMINCGEKRVIHLRSGEGMIIGDTFRTDGRSVEDAISFGKIREHSAKRESESAI